MKFGVGFESQRNGRGVGVPDQEDSGRSKRGAREADVGTGLGGPAGGSWSLGTRSLGSLGLVRGQDALRHSTHRGCYDPVGGGLCHRGQGALGAAPLRWGAAQALRLGFRV